MPAAAASGAAAAGCHSSSRNPAAGAGVLPYMLTAVGGARLAAPDLVRAGRVVVAVNGFGGGVGVGVVVDRNGGGGGVLGAGVKGDSGDALNGCSYSLVSAVLVAVATRRQPAAILG